MMKSYECLENRYKNKMYYCYIFNLHLLLKCIIIITIIIIGLVDMGPAQMCSASPKTGGVAKIWELYKQKKPLKIPVSFSS